MKISRDVIKKAKKIVEVIAPEIPVNKIGSEALIETIINFASKEADRVTKKLEEIQFFSEDS